VLSGGISYIGGKRFGHFEFEAGLEPAKLRRVNNTIQAVFRLGEDRIHRMRSKKYYFSKIILLNMIE
jgi:hypothetical protein